jgi:endonuclease/exonuclease/phosphatase family metal-dependent hydrolase
MRMTTIATWNLHHMGNEVSIPPEVVAVIERVRPDVLVLTEFVDRGGRADFIAALARIGYRKPMHSEAGKEPRQNQVLVASLHGQEDGSLEAPKVDEAARTNFLHQRLPGPRLELDLIGFRAPFYKKKTEIWKRGPYWEGIKTGALAIAQGRTVYIGDFNWCPGAREKNAGEAIGALLAAGYRMLPEGGGVDRALVSAALEPRGWQVVEEAAGLRLTGEGGLSDHPMLIVEVA